MGKNKIIDKNKYDDQKQNLKYKSIKIKFKLSNKLLSLITIYSIIINNHTF